MGNEEVERYWMVHGIGMRMPTVKHFSREKARNEAQRLARESPGVTFVVLEAIQAFKIDQVPVRQVPIAEPRPF